CRVFGGCCLAQRLSDIDVLQHGGVRFDSCGQRCREATNETGGLQSGWCVRLAAVECEHLAVLVAVHKLGDDCRFPDSRPPGDEERGPLAAREPFIDAREEPFAADEPFALLGEERAEVPRLLLPTPVAPWAATILHGFGYGGAKRTTEIRTYSVRFAPFPKVEILQVENPEGRLAGDDHDRNDWDAARIHRVRDLLQADAVGRIRRIPDEANRVRAEQRNENLRVAQSLTDFFRPAPACADPLGVLPDRLPVGDQKGSHLL